MRTETIPLSPAHPGATLTTYLNAATQELSVDGRDAVIVCPGGGYVCCSEREAEPIALCFLAAGMNAFVLRYTVKTPERNGAANFAPLIEAALAVKHVRDHAKEYQINPRRVFVIGFSAGAHLAASVAILWNLPEVSAALGGAPAESARPDGMLLCYPVISGIDHPHLGSFQMLCDKENPPTEELRRYSLELHVNANTPPAFLWHTAEDATVPVENSLAMARALSAAKVPYELHVFPYGAHGLSLADYRTGNNGGAKAESHAHCWMDLALRWIAMTGK